LSDILAEPSAKVPTQDLVRPLLYCMAMSSSHAEQAWRLVRWLALVSFGAILFALPPALILLVAAETKAGRLLGVSVVGSIVAVVLLARLANGRTRSQWQFFSCAVAAAMIAWGAAALLTPSGMPSPSSTISSIYPDEHGYPRYAISNIVPEIDQVNVATRIIWMLDRLIDRAQAERIRSLTIPIYRRMSADADVEALGSAMSYAYAELFGGIYDVGHYYQVKPMNADAARPAIIFLHGSAGNFKSYIFAWKKFAESRGFIVVCPSFGFGNWDRPGGQETIERLRRRLIELEHVDPEKIFLGGISNGGVGVAIAAATHPEYYRGIFFVSPVFSERALSTERFIEGWTRRPVLIIHGERDNRVPKAYVDSVARGLSEGDASVSYSVYSNEDHFLFFSSIDRALAEVEEWTSADLAMMGD
jgi:pimeloyl-ACP methyl ester carboxylesterase